MITMNGKNNISNCTTPCKIPDSYNRYKEGKRVMRLKKIIRQKYGKRVSNGIDIFGYICQPVDTLPWGKDLFVDLRRLVTLEESIIFDVGANDGSWSKRLSKLFPKAHFYCFEPIPEINERLRGNLEAVQSSIEQVALGDVAGVKEFYIYESSDYSGFSENSDAETGYRIIEIDVITIDDYISRKGISKIEFIKIDVEGHEQLVIEGASKSLRDGAINWILCEFRAHDSSLQDLVKYLSQYGYFVFSVYTGYTSKDRGMRYGDVLFGRADASVPNSN